MPSNESRNAIDLLKQDHREVESLFARLESESSDERKIELGRSICIALTVHAQIEEELFYPAAKEALSEDREDMVAEATVEHASLKQLIADIDGSAPGDELFEARFKVLKEYVQHHVQEEENELMPAVRRTDVDLDALGARLAERKAALEGELGSARPATGARARRISVPKLPHARRASGRTTRRAAGKKGATAPAKKRKSAPAASSRSSRASKRPARKAAAPAKTSARKRTQTRRSRSARS